MKVLLELLNMMFLMDSAQSVIPLRQNITSLVAMAVIVMLSTQFEVKIRSLESKSSDLTWLTVRRWPQRIPFKAINQLNIGVGGTSWQSIQITTNSSMHYSPLNGLIWASSATINQHFYVFGGVDSNNENAPSNKVRVSIFFNLNTLTLIGKFQGQQPDRFLEN